MIGSFPLTAKDFPIKLEAMYEFERDKIGGYEVTDWYCVYRDTVKIQSEEMTRDFAAAIKALVAEDFSKNAHIIARADRMDA